MMKKLALLSTELFIDKKDTPAFVRENMFFLNNPIKIKKIFPSIGLPNFQEPCNIDKPLIDVKREGTFVFNMIASLGQQFSVAKESAFLAADILQYLALNKEQRQANKQKSAEIYHFANVLTTLMNLTDPYMPDVLNSTVKVNDGKIELRLSKDINDIDGKPLFRSGQALFKVYNKVRERIELWNLNLLTLEQLPAFKQFCNENIPHKEFKIVFSSDGKEGAWDLLTMSMRGIKSCQRWDGEYPKCLIGSILSRFVGIIYLTSGADIQGYGSKMLRRCIVRYAVDLHNNTPCILVDRLYPDPSKQEDRDVLNALLNSIKNKIKEHQEKRQAKGYKEQHIPVYYGPDMSITQLKYFYMPNEDMRDKLGIREWSYQDTPIRTKRDMDEQILTNRRDEANGVLNAFQFGLSNDLFQYFSGIYNHSITTTPDIQRCIKNIGFNISLLTFSKQVSQHLINSFNIIISTEDSLNSSIYYRKFLSKLLIQKVKLAKTVIPGLSNIFESSHLLVDHTLITNLIMERFIHYAKQEFKSLLN